MKETPSKDVALCLIFFLNLQVICSSSFDSSSTPTKLCPHEQSLALLQFKNSISITTQASGLCNRDVTSYPKTKSWKEGTDCCFWDGVTCDKLTGNVIGLDLSSSLLHGIIHDNSSLFLLQNLQRVNLACNNFRESQISSKFGSLTEVTHLNLSSTHFYGQVPTEIFHLSQLVSLDLSFNGLNGLQLSQSSFNLLQNLTKLRYLFLGSVYLDSAPPASLVNLSSLISLSLADTGLGGEFPIEVFHFPFLQWLSLQSNEHLTGNLPTSNWSAPLRGLDLYGTGFSGKLPFTIGNLIHLEMLDLSECKFTGSIPTSLWNLTRIIYLDLTSNNLTGQFPASLSNLESVVFLFLANNYINGQLSSSAFNHTSLSHLDISYNQLDDHFPNYVEGLSNLVTLILSHNFLNGRVPSWLFTLPLLKRLDLSNNKLIGPLDEFRKPNSVNYVKLQSNEIHGPIPNSIYGLVNLILLNLSSNNLSGVLMPSMLSKLKNLESVNLSHNNLLSLGTSGNVNFTMPMLRSFYFSSCNLSKFPIFLRTSANLEYLDLSSNRIPGRISQRDSELWKNLFYLDLSHNFLTSFEQVPSTQLVYLDLRSNLLQGPPVVPPDSTQSFSISDNELTGEIPASFCNLSSIRILDLSKNSLSGKIPECLVNHNRLSVLDLRMNFFHGRVPQSCAKHDVLDILNLNGNNLEGPLPTSLVNCTSLEILDVGNNKINDTFPYWLANLQNLQVLVLRSNRFHGPIGDSEARFPFPMLRILDISHNSFTGLLPTRFFNNFMAMMHGENDIDVQVEYMGYDFYRYSVILSLKGIGFEMEKVLTIFTTIDMSNNQFQGQIPESIGNLNSLKGLNLSCNSLVGHIPASLRNLTELESLDLSSNKLTGQIPVELTNLNFLSVINLSYNQLTGRIPQGNQFDTFQNNSYIGNLGLCGLPMSEQCSKDEGPEPTPSIFLEEDNTLTWLDWKIIMTGYASGLVIGLSIGYVVCSTGKPKWFIRKIEQEGLDEIRRLRQRIGIRN